MHNLKNLIFSTQYKNYVAVQTNTDIIELELTPEYNYIFPYPNNFNLKKLSVSDIYHVYNKQVDFGDFNRNNITSGLVFDLFTDDLEYNESII